MDGSENPVNAYWGYDDSDPLPVSDGLVPENPSGPFARNWWSRRWLRGLTHVASSSRLSRGRGYARRGQVMWLEVEPGFVTAQVQGTRPEPYTVRIRMRVFDDAEWARILDELARQAMYIAHLLNGEMPHGIEAVFEAAHLPLFPSSGSDLSATCTCPDRAAVCKHIAAVLYLSGERLDRDPFLLFTLRGRTKAIVLAALREHRVPSLSWDVGGQTMLEPATSGAAVAASGTELLAGSPSGQALASFWSMGPEADQLRIKIAPPAIEGELLKLLGDPGVPDTGFAERLAAVYRRVSQRALAVAFAEQTKARDED